MNSLRKPKPVSTPVVTMIVLCQVMSLGLIPMVFAADLPKNLPGDRSAQTENRSMTSTELKTLDKKQQSLVEQKEAVANLQSQIQDNLPVASASFAHQNEAAVSEANNLFWDVTVGQNSIPGWSPSSANAIAVDNEDNSIVAGLDGGGVAGRWAVRKFNSRGQIVWEYFSDPTAGVDYISGVAVDQNGNIIAVGSVQGGTLIRVEKISAQGQRVWTYEKDPTVGVDQAMSVATDAVGNIYVGGYTSGGQNGQWFMTKLNSQGITQWEKTSDPSAIANYSAGGETIWSVKVGPQNSVYFLGFDAGGKNGQWRLERRNATTGNVEWVYTSDPTNAVSDTAFALAVDQITGYAYLAGHDGNGVRVEAVDRDGHQVWVYNDVSHTGSTTVASISLDGKGNLYVVGQEENGAKAMIRKLTVNVDRCGTMQWLPNRVSMSGWGLLWRGMDLYGWQVITGQVGE